MTCGNTISGNTLSSNGTDTRNIGVGFGIVTNTTTNEVFCSIQSAINDLQTIGGHTLEVTPGTYNELVTVNKSLTVKSEDAMNKAVVTYNAAPGGGVTPTLFKVTAQNVSIEDLEFNVDLAYVGFGHPHEWGRCWPTSNRQRDFILQVNCWRPRLWPTERHRHQPQLR